MSGAPGEETGFGLYRGDDLYGVDLSRELAESARTELESRRLLDGTMPDKGKFRVVPVLIIPLPEVGA